MLGKCDVTQNIYSHITICYLGVLILYLILKTFHEAFKKDVLFNFFLSGRIFFKWYVQEHCTASDLPQLLVHLPKGKDYFL